jgi:hypothetical protein
MGPGFWAAGRRRWALAALAVAVTAAHLGLGRWLQVPGLGADGPPPLRRMEVAFVQELQPAAPPAPPAGRVATAQPPAAPGALGRLLTPPPAGEASEGSDVAAETSGPADGDRPQAEQLEPAPEPAPEPAREPAEEGPAAAPPWPPPDAPDTDTAEVAPAAPLGPAGQAAGDTETEEVVATAGVAASPEGGALPDTASAASVSDTSSAADPGGAAGSAPMAVADAGAQSGRGSGAEVGPEVGPEGDPEGDPEVGPEWPLSTRLSYVLTGHFRGPVDGQARVDWLRQGERYQVHLDLSVGPFFAPLASRRLSSEGRITPAGLHPERYEEETRIAFREPRRLRIEMGPARLRLPAGRELPRPPGVQDSASQFVHMTWLFTMQPGRLQPGTTLELPLALPRSVEPWVYDVTGTDTLYTPMGALPVVHVRPRREPGAGGDLTAEFWVAPTLQYLPARILIRQSEEVWIDLRLDRLPQQAASPGR